MKLFALVPVKDPALGKSRLAPLLNEGERRALNLYFARRTLAVCARVFGPAHTLVVTRSAMIEDLAREAGAKTVAENGRDDGINSALAAAAGRAIGAGADGIVVVPTDLALITEASLRAAIAAMPGPPGCVLVPDRRGTGTNLLAHSPVRADLFSFGEPSLERHASLAKLAGYDVRIHHCEALGLDLDRAEDFIHLRRTTAWPTFESTIRKASESRLDSIRM
jgi:2-phospho-L-lactate guanylyltransferase